MIFLNSFTLLQLDRLQLTAVTTTPQMPREYGAKHVKKWLQVEVG